MATEYCGVINEIKNPWKIGLKAYFKNEVWMQLLWNFLSYKADSCPILYHGPKLLVPDKDKRQG